MKAILPVRVYIACSLDGFIAGPGDGLAVPGLFQVVAGLAWSRVCLVVATVALVAVLSACATTPVSQTAPPAQQNAAPVPVASVGSFLQSIKLVTPMGEVDRIEGGYFTEEGDFCQVTVSPGGGFVATANHTWSGVPCEWLVGRRHFPLAGDSQGLLQKALSELSTWQVKDEAKTADIDELNRPYLVVAGVSYLLPHAIEMVNELARNQISKWATRERDGLGLEVLVARSRPGHHVRVEAEPHGILVYSIHIGDEIRGAVYIMSAGERRELRRLVGELSAHEEISEGADDAEWSLVKYRKIVHRFAAGAVPPAVEELVDWIMTPLRRLR